MRAIVTGAASGIGRATCLRLARDGIAAGQQTMIGALDVAHTPQLDELLSEIQSVGATSVPIVADLAEPSAPATAVREALEAFGGLDGIVSNAGVNRPGPLLELPVDAWDRLFAVNTRATWLLAKAAHPALKESKGAIVATASMSGSHPHANLGAYAPSKAAVIMLAGVLAQEFGPDGIRVNTVSQAWCALG